MTSELVWTVNNQELINAGIDLKRNSFSEDDINKILHLNLNNAKQIKEVCGQIPFLSFLDGKVNYKEMKFCLNWIKHDLRDSNKLCAETILNIYKLVVCKKCDDQKEEIEKIAEILNKHDFTKIEDGWFREEQCRLTSDSLQISLSVVDASKDNKLDLEYCCNLWLDLFLHSGRFEVNKDKSDFKQGFIALNAIDWDKDSFDAEDFTVEVKSDRPFYTQCFKLDENKIRNEIENELDNFIKPYTSGNNLEWDEEFDCTIPDFTPELLGVDFNKCDLRYYCNEDECVIKGDSNIIVYVLIELGYHDKEVNEKLNEDINSSNNYKDFIEYYIWHLENQGVSWLGDHVRFYSDDNYEYIYVDFHLDQASFFEDVTQSEQVNKEIDKLFNKKLKSAISQVGAITNWGLSRDSINTIAKEASYQFTGNRIKFENSEGELELYNVIYDNVIVKDDTLELVEMENFFATRQQDFCRKKMYGHLDGTFKLKVERIK